MRTEYSQKYITMGLKIAYYRKKAGYTQEVFAEKIGKSVNDEDGIIKNTAPATIPAAARKLSPTFFIHPFP